VANAHGSSSIIVELRGSGFAGSLAAASSIHACQQRDTSPAVTYRPGPQAVTGAAYLIDLAVLLLL
jgi:hypothetical protein